MIIRSRAPYRIEFGGGGTDMPPYVNNYGGCAVNATINKYSYATLIPSKDGLKINAEHKKTFLFRDFSSVKYDGDLDLIKAVIKQMKPDINLEIFLRNDMAPNSGLGTGASSAIATIGLTNFFADKNLNKYEIAELSYKILSEELGLIGGKQNHYATSFGGLNFIEFNSKGITRVSPLNLKKEAVMELQKHLLLVYDGRRTDSNITLGKQAEKSVNKTEILDKLKATALDMRYALEKGDFGHFGNLLNIAWQTKKELNPNITSHYIDRIYNIAMKNGALGGRIMGAGGGGHMLFYCEPNKEHLVAKKLQENGANITDFSFDMEGLQVWTLGGKNER